MITSTSARPVGEELEVLEAEVPVGAEVPRRVVDHAEAGTGPDGGEGFLG